MLWEFRFDVNPVSASRPRVTRAGHSYYAGPYKNFRNDMKLQVEDHLKDFDPLSGPLCVEVNLHCAQPKKTKLFTPRADVDNYAKAVLDSFNNVLWNDDSQIVDLRVTKQWTESNGIPGWIDLSMTKDIINYEQNEDGTWRFLGDRT